MENKLSIQLDSEIKVWSGWVVLDLDHVPFPRNSVARYTDLVIQRQLFTVRGFTTQREVYYRLHVYHLAGI